VATFYTMYKRRPTGDCLVSVCTNTMCDVLGGGRVYEMLSEYLGVGHDQTTADGRITLEHAECLAACDYGPVMTVNYEFYDQVTVESALDVVTRHAGGRPTGCPAAGPRLCTAQELPCIWPACRGPPESDCRRGRRRRHPARLRPGPSRTASRSPRYDPDSPIKAQKESVMSGHVAGGARKLTPVLTRRWGHPRRWQRETYEAARRLPRAAARRWRPTRTT
jgi:NADH-quinone oxidoreductase subunit E